jgi:hypothetical protein
MDWIDQAWDGFERLAVVIAVMCIYVSWKAGNFLTSWASIGFSNMKVFPEASDVQKHLREWKYTADVCTARSEFSGKAHQLLHKLPYH